ncbi:hypothetical protein [Gilvimarinus polysaccharolyticus]|uniref:hypothetical protein n=1 Tax=Gilvimarinus polysaccharolyticus TaxID=863921 RepID=UPI0006736F19|nr:hypothetical protein [Gilvimarinus polysaccharolyticus]
MRLMARSVVLLMSLWATACSTVLPFSAGKACLPLLDSTARLKVQYDGHTEYLLLRTEQNAGGVVFVALDTIGSPQFSANLNNGQLALERSPLYRGLEPAVLLWGYNWWQLRTEPRAICAESVGLQLHQTTSTLSLTQNGQPSWHWSSAQPMQFDLPQLGARVSVIPLEK